MNNLKKILSALIVVVMIAATCTSALASMNVVTTGKCNLRENAGLNYKSKTTVPSGTKLTATASKTDSRGVMWLKVKYNGKTGWVSTVYLKKGSSSSKSSKVVIATGDTYIRSKANKESKKLGVLYTGCHATYLNKSSKDSRGVRWYKISYGGNVGWVSSKNSYVK